LAGGRGTIPVMLSYSWDFIRAVARHWGSLVTGGFFIGVIGTWQATGHNVPPAVYWGIALIALFIAFFKAWVDERKAKEFALGQAHGQQGQETWLSLYKEKERLENELESLELPEPPPSLKDVSINAPLLSGVRYVTYSESYKSEKRERRIKRIKEELEFITDRLNTVPQIPLDKP